jgi:AcrR family transcriptional regulator
MDIPNEILKSFRTLLGLMPYDKITIADICSSAGVSRKTLYRYYENKQHLVVSLVQEDMIKPTLDLQHILPIATIKSMPKLILEQAYTTLRDNQLVYQNLLTHLGKPELTEIFLEEIWSYTRGFFAEYDLSIGERDFGSYFIAASQAMIQIRYIEEGARTAPSEMAKYCIAYLFAHIREMGKMAI